MKTTSFLFLLVSFFLCGQLDAKLFDAVIVDQTGKSTNCQIRASTKLFSSEIDEVTMNTRIRVVLPDGRKLKFRPDELQQVILRPAGENQRVFESVQMGQRVVLMEVISRGRIPLYRHFFTPHGGFASMSCYAVTGPNGETEPLAPIDWRLRLTKIFPGDAYFQQERKEKNFTLNELPQLLAEYENGYAGSGNRN